MAVLKLSQIAAAGAAPALTDQAVGVTGGITDNLFTVAQVFAAQNLVSDASNILAQRNGTNAQTFRVYNTFTSATNFERGIFDWNGTANVLTIATEAGGGGGSNRNIKILAAGNIITMMAGGNIIAYFNNGSSSLDMTNSMVLGFEAGITGAPDVGVSRSAAGVLAFGNGSGNDASATIKAKTKAGAPTTSDVPSGTWVLIRDTTNATTKLYYNNAGTLQTVALV